MSSKGDYRPRPRSPAGSSRPKEDERNKPASGQPHDDRRAPERPKAFGGGHPARRHQSATPEAGEIKSDDMLKGARRNQSRSTSPAVPRDGPGRDSRDRTRPYESRPRYRERSRTPPGYRGRARSPPPGRYRPRSRSPPHRGRSRSPGYRPSSRSPLPYRARSPGYRARSPPHRPRSPTYRARSRTPPRRSRGDPPRDIARRPRSPSPRSHHASSSGHSPSVQRAKSPRPSNPRADLSLPSQPEEPNKAAYSRGSRPEERKDAKPDIPLDPSRTSSQAVPAPAKPATLSSALKPAAAMSSVPTAMTKTNNADRPSIPSRASDSSSKVETKPDPQAEVDWKTVSFKPTARQQPSLTADLDAKVDTLRAKRLNDYFGRDLKEQLKAFKIRESLELYTMDANMASERAQLIAAQGIKLGVVCMPNLYSDQRAPRHSTTHELTIPAWVEHMTFPPCRRTAVVEEGKQACLPQGRPFDSMREQQRHLVLGARLVRRDEEESHEPEPRDDLRITAQQVVDESKRTSQQRAQAQKNSGSVPSQPTHDRRKRHEDADRHRFIPDSGLKGFPAISSDFGRAPGKINPRLDRLAHYYCSLAVDLEHQLQQRCALLLITRHIHDDDQHYPPFVSVLGVGAYGVVYLARDIQASISGDGPVFYAVKCLNKLGLDTRQRKFQLRELALHSLAAAHPNIVSLHKILDTPSCIYVILSYCPDGDLFGMITEKSRYLGDDKLIRHVFLQIVEAVEYCHSQQIYHRDLKPENILCCDDGKQVLLADFGLATSEKTSGDFGCGSTFYMSPECQGGLYHRLSSYSTPSNDVWSLGVILVNLTCGRNPWKQACPSDETFRAFTKNPDFLRSILPVSKPCNELLKRIFALDPEERINITELRAAAMAIPHWTMTSEELKTATKATREAAKAVIAATAAKAAVAPMPIVFTAPAWQGVPATAAEVERALQSSGELYVDTTSPEASSSSSDEVFSPTSTASSATSSASSPPRSLHKRLHRGSIPQENQHVSTPRRPSYPTRIEDCNRSVSPLRTPELVADSPSSVSSGSSSQPPSSPQTPSKSRTRFDIRRLSLLQAKKWSSKESVVSCSSTSSSATSWMPTTPDADTFANQQVQVFDAFSVSTQSGRRRSSTYEYRDGKDDSKSAYPWAMQPPLAEDCFEDTEMEVDSHTYSYPQELLPSHPKQLADVSRSRPSINAF
ncbi:uncharacterized protein L969DRAFT_92073 [Mixia osmundae IAM 14324]|uniref:non-specific serine/threonine protein kinase n=1 Tax=Mixia osmundae (strain CBS 9802 / IAM 14324 / JCM 22182 / KY 12970) TaxID=764103 RepID=G7DX88_MIXOS|nr:uncharacterized protein L969DRAFT_92073 [Mixia osmundae IAM 14324]KEI42639.1 hypothetical protein L969DRAFT_92073 [Mixia osmundae IAM 14324]GAA95198.1 hypothetical protein E5Q_01853 [Mixia osmundae IAM 14324]